MSASVPIVSVVVVTYNSAHVVCDALRGLASGPEIEVIVVDNASSDDGISKVLAVRPDARVVRNAANLGFARAVNLGAAMANGDYILLLNPDASIAPGDLGALVDFMSVHPNVAISAPLSEDGDGSFATVAAGYPPTIVRMFTHASGLARLSRWLPALRGHYLLRSQVMGTRPLTVSWVSGGCMLVRASAWLAVGGLPERWFMYAEDVAFCLDVGRAGHSVVLVPEAHAVHAVGGSSSGSGSRINTLWIENLFDLYRWRYARTHAHSLVWKWVVISGFWFRVAYLALADRLRGGSRSADIARFSAYAKALARTRVR